jgi:hypothetical protein
MLGDSTDGFTFEGLARRLRIQEPSRSTATSCKVFDEAMGELVDVEELALREWLEQGSHSAGDENFLPQLVGTVCSVTDPADTPVIDWGGSFARMGSRTGGRTPALPALQ